MASLGDETRLPETKMIIGYEEKNLSTPGDKA
jgi:hypothetical protein